VGYTFLRGSPRECYVQFTTDRLTKPERIVQSKSGTRSAGCWNECSCRTIHKTPHSRSASRGDSSTSPCKVSEFTFTGVRNPSLKIDRHHTCIPSQKETQLRACHRNTRQEVQSFLLSCGTELLFERFRGFFKSHYLEHHADAGEGVSESSHSDDHPRCSKCYVPGGC